MRHSVKGFGILCSSDVNTLDLPYDLDSVMHYVSDAFAKAEGMDTIVPKEGNKDIIGTIAGFSKLDLEKLNKYYERKKIKLLILFINNNEIFISSLQKILFLFLPIANHVNQRHFLSRLLFHLRLELISYFKILKHLFLRKIIFLHLTGDGDSGGVPATTINWDGNDWAQHCDFSSDKDLLYEISANHSCSGTCSSTPGCRHYTWTDENNGTCWMKKGGASKSDTF